MRLLTLVCGLAVSAAWVAPVSAADELNILTAAEKQAGWKLLFDGKTTAGWRNYKKTDVSAGWKVVDGALSREGEKAGDIITADQYGAFELSIDFKIAPEGNSGIMYRVRETENTPWQTGPEIQIQDNKAGHDPQKCGWLYQFYKTDKDATKPAGEWNTLNILITPEKCVHTMNGVKYFEYVIGSDDWKEKLAASKFAKYSDFGKFETGHICLQDHNDPVAYRNIKIRPISGTSAKATTAAAAPKANAPAATTTTTATANAPTKAEPKPQAKPAPAAAATAESKPAATKPAAKAAAVKPAETKPTAKVETPAKADVPAATAETTATAEADQSEAPAAGTTRTYTTRPTIRSRVRRLIDRVTP
jgi:hypothetical protein